MAGASNAYAARLANNFSGQTSPGDAFPTTLEFRLGTIVQAETGLFTELTTTGYAAVSISVSGSLTFGPKSTNGKLGLNAELNFGTNTSGADVPAADFDGCAIWDTTADEMLFSGTIIGGGSDWLAGYTLIMNVCEFDWNAN